MGCLKMAKTGQKLGRKIHQSLILGSMGLLSLILALFWAHWAANTLFWDLKTLDSGLRSTFFSSISSPLFQKMGGGSLYSS